MSVFPLKNVIYVTSKTSAMPLIQAQQLTDFTHSFKLLGFMYVQVPAIVYA